MKMFRKAGDPGQGQFGAQNGRCRVRDRSFNGEGQRQSDSEAG